MRIAFLSFVLSSLLFAGGDPPFLTEPGWTPLLNGKDVQGWHAQNAAKPHEWQAASGIGFDHYYQPKALRIVGGSGDRMVNGPKGNTQNIVSDWKHGDVELYLEFVIPRGANSGVYLQGLYEVQILDSTGVQDLHTGDCGAIYHRWINDGPVGGSPPKVNASKPAGEWQSYHIWFRAPRFDAAGKKIENAKFLRVLWNGILVQENFEVDGGTRAHMEIPEAASNPLMLQGDHGPVAFRNIYWRPLRTPPAR